VKIQEQGLRGFCSQSQRKPIFEMGSNKEQVQFSAACCEKLQLPFNALPKIVFSTKPGTGKNVKSNKGK
jgi:hypothetical protein